MNTTCRQCSAGPLVFLAMPAPSAPRTLPVAFEAGNTLDLAWIHLLTPGSCILRFNEVPGRAGTLRLARVDLLDREFETYAPDARIPYGPQALLGLRVD